MKANTRDHPTKEELTAYVDDELAERGEETIREHINTCNRCLDQFLDLINPNVHEWKGVTEADGIGSFSAASGLFDPVG